MGWNPFQLLHVRSLIEALPGACFILEKRKDYASQFDADLLADPDVPVLIWPQSKMRQLDGMFDIIVCQTPFTGIQHFQNTKIAMIQYGYAKEPHNYGAWRSLADLNLVYGRFAADKIKHFSPVEVIGNPRYDSWQDDGFQAAARKKFERIIDNNRRTVLYAPTWGYLSSVDEYLHVVYELSKKYNVLVKMHHNTELLEPSRRDRMDLARVSHFGANDSLLELLAVSDLLISDYSGAIFDSIFCRKPVVLLDIDIQQKVGNKIDEYSLEYARRSELGCLVSKPSELFSAVSKTLNDSAIALTKVEELRAELFNDSPDATKRASDALTALASGAYIPNQIHSYIRNAMLELYSSKEELARAKRKAKRQQGQG